MRKTEKQMQKKYIWSQTCIYGAKTVWHPDYSKPSTITLNHHLLLSCLPPTSMINLETHCVDYDTIFLACFCIGGNWGYQILPLQWISIIVLGTFPCFL